MRDKGYSLLELVVVVTIVAILATLAMTSFSQLIANHRLRVEANALFHAIHLARKESVMRRRAVSICPSIDGSSCDEDNDWSQGWLLFENSNGNAPPTLDAGEPLLQQHRISADIQINSNRRAFTLRSTQLRATNGTIKFCDRRDRAESRALVISYTGRPRISYLDSRNKAYVCAD